MRLILFHLGLVLRNLHTFEDQPWQIPNLLEWSVHSSVPGELGASKCSFSSVKTHFSFLLVFIIFIINLWSFQRWSVGCTLLQNIWNWTWFIIIDVWCDGKSEIHLPTLVRQLLCLEPTDNLTQDHCFNLQSLPPPHTSFYCHWKEGQMSSVWIFEEESFDQTFCCIQCSSLPVLWLQTKFEPGIWKANTEGAWHDHWVHR